MKLLSTLQDLGIGMSGETGEVAARHGRAFSASTESFQTDQHTATV